MAKLTIDTEEFAARLTRAKVSKEQAEAITRGLKKDVYLDTTELATKKDLEILRREMKADMQNMNLKGQITTIVILGGLMAAFRFWV